MIWQAMTVVTAMRLFVGDIVIKRQVDIGIIAK